MTDSKWQTDKPIEFIDVSHYELDTWWNKVAMFDSPISRSGANIYFDLDVNITGNIDFLFHNIEKNKLCVVDTLWKDGNFVEDAIKSKKNGRGFYHYGNTSVMGWMDNDHQYLFDGLVEDPFLTIEHFSDDSYINTTASIKYFEPLICNVFSGRYSESMVDKRMWIHFKDPP